MKVVKDCPCAAKNENYPYEGFMTRHKCVLKKDMQGICDQETGAGCKLFECMRNDSGLLDFIKSWVK